MQFLIRRVFLRCAFLYSNSFYSLRREDTLLWEEELCSQTNQNRTNAKFVIQRLQGKEIYYYKKKSNKSFFF